MYFSIKTNKNKAFFVIERKCGTFIHKTLAEKISLQNKDSNFSDYSESELWFGFSDPSSYEYAGWPARSFLTMLAVLWLV